MKRAPSTWDDVEGVAHDLAVLLAALPCQVGCATAPETSFWTASQLCPRCLAKWHIQGIRLLLGKLNGATP